jgi:hypothetical protein
MTAATNSAKIKGLVVGINATNKKELLERKKASVAAGAAEQQHKAEYLSC